MCLQQLSPTIQGSEPEHECGLEQTMFDRLMKMVRWWEKKNGLVFTSAYFDRIWSSEWENLLVTDLSVRSILISYEKG